MTDEKSLRQRACEALGWEAIGWTLSHKLNENHHECHQTRNRKTHDLAINLGFEVIETHWPDVDTDIAVAWRALEQVCVERQLWARVTGPNSSGKWVAGLYWENDDHCLGIADGTAPEAITKAIVAALEVK